MKKGEIREMTYGDLCQEFNEEKKDYGKARKNQFNRWRKEYSIVKIEGKNKYQVRKLDIAERKDIKNASTSYTSQLRETIYKYLKTKYHVIKTTNELMEELFLVNKDFFNNTEEFCKTNFNMTPTELNVYKDEVKKFTKRAIRKILNEMQDDGLIVLYDEFEVTLDMGNNVEQSIYIEKGDTCAIISRRNELAKQYGTIYEKLDVETQYKINAEVNEMLGYKFHKSVIEIFVDTATVDYCLENKEKFLLTKKDEAIMNDLSQLKFLGSEQGALKELDINKKSIINNKIIKRRK